MGRQCQPHRDIVFLALSHKRPFLRQRMFANEWLK
jgi:hypothetical protein